MRRVPIERRATDSASYCRYSSDLQQSESIGDQQRKCREAAAGNRDTVTAEFEFADEAVSGTKLARDGLDRLLEAARARRFGTLYLENLSRLARESVISFPLLKELVEVLGIRVISISEDIDTDRPGWELSAAILGIQHERYVKDLGAYVFRGQEGVVLAGHSVGDMCFGFTSVPIEGSEATRRGRAPKPRMKYVIDPEPAAWVVRVFRWFAVEKRSMSWIARELTRLGCPKDHRATTPAWHPQYVRRVLDNTKYIGFWPWGRAANRRDPFTGKVSQDARPAEECSKWLRHFPDLRIVDDALWDNAQRRLAEVGASQAGTRREGKFAGRPSGGAGTSPRHLLAGLLLCGKCGLTFQVGGCNGIYLACRGHVTGQCDCRTLVPRSRAERMIVEAIAERILADEGWHGAVGAALRAENRALSEVLPTRLAEARSRLAVVERKIERLLDHIENGTTSVDVEDRLGRRRAEKGQLERELEALERIDEGRLPEPTEAWVSEQFASLGAILAEGGPAAALALRNLVGGRIIVDQVERPGQKRHFMRARFSIKTAALMRAGGRPGRAAVGGAAMGKRK